MDAARNAYVTGYTDSTDFPVANAIQPTNHGGYDAFVTKINARGSALLYSTYLGGGKGEGGEGIAVDSERNAYVAGVTGSVDFPTANPLQPTLHSYWAADAFVTKLNATGSALVYSTYLGGTDDDAATSIAVDALGNGYVSGWTVSTDFPTLNAIQPICAGCGDGPWGGPPWGDAFVTKINATGNALVYSTFLGGKRDDSARAIAVDGSGNAYVSGWTESTSFPRIDPIQRVYPWSRDAFVTKINAEGNAFLYSTPLGGRGWNDGSSIAVDATGTAYVTGWTESDDFPVTAFAFQPTVKGGSYYFDAFVSKIASQTFLGVSPERIGFGVVVVGQTSAPKQLTVTNVGSGALAINNIFVGGGFFANATDFAIQNNNCPPMLPAGDICTISVTFTPTDKDKREAALGISDSDPASPHAIPLSGFGTGVSLSPKSLTFGKVPVGSNSAPKTVILTNVGSAQLNFTGFSITGKNPTDYSQTNTCDSSIAAGANCTITVTFAPTATGTRKATVSISDDGGGSPQIITLTGTGT